MIIRPAGSAVVELDEPTSKSQKGPAVIQPLAYDPVHASPIQVPTFTHSVSPAPFFTPSSTPAPAIASTTVPTTISEEESVVVDNPEFRNANSAQNEQRLFAPADLTQVMLLRNAFVFLFCFVFFFAFIAFRTTLN